MAIQFSGISNAQPLQQTKSTTFTAHTPKLEMGQDTVSFGNAATKAAKEIADDVVKSKPVREFLGKMLKPIGNLLVKCKNLIIAGGKATGTGAMKALKFVKDVIVWPFVKLAGMFAKKAPEAAKVAEEVVKAAT